ncbi:MAG: hypothetical protein QNJ41_27495 [Xenococcaceae cyanobacterium MO_188.B32]|nr:hypothetical protein [Xenococcaceae cyanobacterium MO_188.B32]
MIIAGEQLADFLANNPSLPDNFSDRSIQLSSDKQIILANVY